MTNLAYEIQWYLVKIISGKMSKSKKAQIEKVCNASISFDDNYFFFYTFRDRPDIIFAVQNLIIHSRMKTEIYSFSDKQFGLIANSHTGEFAQIPKPFKHAVFIGSGAQKSTVPLTAKQLNDVMYI